MILEQKIQAVHGKGGQEFNDKLVSTTQPASSQQALDIPASQGKGICKK